MEALAQLGIDHGAFGSVAAGATPSGRCAYAISAGHAVQERQKGVKPVPNEDALLVLEWEQGSLLAVADAHFGYEASHELIEGLHAGLGVFPASVEQLYRRVADCFEGRQGGRYRSEASLLVAALERESRSVFGISYGDSSILLCGSEGPPRQLNPKNSRWVSPCKGRSLAGARATVFEAQAGPEDVLLAFTDGVDECHYRQPALSIQGRHIEQLLAEGREPLDVVGRLAALALAGVDGYPGGEDNIAIVCAGGRPG